MASTRLNHDNRPPVDVINDMLYQGESGGRCTFACQATYSQSLVPSTRPPRSYPSSAASRLPHDPTLFRTTFKTPLQLDLKIESASKNVAGLGPYAPPRSVAREFPKQLLAKNRHNHYRSSHDFRPTGGLNITDDDFRAKFTLPSTQDVRCQIAQNQEGYLKGASLKNITCDRYDPREDGKPAFLLQLPHTSSKTGNLNLRLQVTLDQAGLFQGGQSIRDHQYRHTQDVNVANGIDDAPRFELEFKPSGKGYGCVDIGTKQRPQDITK